MGDDTVTNLIERLSFGRIDAAWSEFLARYPPLIKHVTRRDGLDDDSADECFIHVCGALSDDGFRRLLSFRHIPGSVKVPVQGLAQNHAVVWTLL